MNNLDFKVTMKPLIVFVFLNTLLFVLNAVFFRHSIDAPVDVIFLMVGNIFLPNIFIIVTLLLHHSIESSLTKKYIIKVIFITLVFLSISSLFTIIYTLLFQSKYTLNLLSLYIYIIPFLLTGMIFDLQRNNNYENIYKVIIIYVLSLLVIYIIDITLNDLEYYQITRMIQQSIVFLVPPITLTTFHRKPQ